VRERAGADRVGGSSSWPVHFRPVRVGRCSPGAPCSNRTCVSTRTRRISRPFCMGASCPCASRPAHPAPAAPTRAIHSTIAQSRPVNTHARHPHRSDPPPLLGPCFLLWRTSHLLTVCLLSAAAPAPRPSPGFTPGFRSPAVPSATFSGRPLSDPGTTTSCWGGVGEREGPQRQQPSRTAGDRQSTARSTPRFQESAGGELRLSDVNIRSQRPWRVRRWSAQQARAVAARPPACPPRRRHPQAVAAKRARASRRGWPDGWLRLCGE
jgi:hypothetical protein